MERSDLYLPYDDHGWATLLTHLACYPPLGPSWSLLAIWLVVVAPAAAQLLLKERRVGFVSRRMILSSEAVPAEE